MHQGLWSHEPFRTLKWSQKMVMTSCDSNEDMGKTAGIGFEVNDTVDGPEIRRSPVEVGSSSHYLQGFIHPKWLFGKNCIDLHMW